mmetsp:Transcript_26261/g.81864  ORF Transcript_26261/g.81864 Transcript_26261/m.81864 type:complete len:458 (-) Transcript_26261:712-2085(-)
MRTAHKSEVGLSRSAQATAAHGTASELLDRQPYLGGAGQAGQLLGDDAKGSPDALRAGVGGRRDEDAAAAPLILVGALGRAGRVHDYLGDKQVERGIHLPDLAVELPGLLLARRPQGVGHHYRGRAPVLPEQDNGVHAAVRLAPARIVGVDEDDPPPALQGPVRRGDSALLLPDEPPLCEPQPVLADELDVRGEGLTEVADKVEERREAHLVVLHDRHGVLLSEQAQGHASRAREPLDPVHLGVGVGMEALDLEALLPAVESTHGLRPATKLRRHVREVLTLEGLEEDLRRGPVHGAPLITRLPQAADMVLALAAARLHVPDGCLRLLHLEVDDRLHHKLLEDVREVPRAIGMAHRHPLLLRGRLHVRRAETWVELLPLRDHPLARVEGLAEPPLRGRLVGPGPPEAPLAVDALLLQADGRPAVVHLVRPGGLELALPHGLGLRPLLLPGAALGGAP